MRETPIGIGQHRPKGARTPRVRTHPEFSSTHWDAPNPSHVPSRAGGRTGPALRRLAPLTCSSLPQSRAAQAVRTPDVSATTPAEPRQPAWIGPAQARDGAPPGQPTTHIPTDLDRNRKGAPSPLATMLRRLTKLASGSTLRGAGAVGRQTWSAHVGTRHTHAVPPLHGWWGRGHLRCHRGSTRLHAGQLCLVQLCGGIRPRLGAMGMEHLVSAHHMVRARVMVLWGHCRGCV